MLEEAKILVEKINDFAMDIEDSEVLEQFDKVVTPALVAMRKAIESTGVGEKQTHSSSTHYGWGGMIVDSAHLTDIAHKLETYVAIYTGDKEARAMAKWCRRIARARSKDGSKLFPVQHAPYDAPKLVCEALVEMFGEPCKDFDIGCATCAAWREWNRRGEAEYDFKDLLAIIHQDGGHHTHEHGLYQSRQDAIQAIFKLRREIEESKNPAPNETLDELCKRTFAVQYNPNCHRRWLVRLVGKGQAIIDLKPYAAVDGQRHETNDILGFGDTFEEAAKIALSLSEFVEPSKVSIDANYVIDWAIGRWKAEVANRDLVNIHRRSLDDAWRQVIRMAGGNPDELVGPSHDELLQKGKGND